MDGPNPNEVTQALDRAQSGDPAAVAELWDQLHEQLHDLASRLMQRQDRGHTLQATALMNEAYMRIAGSEGLSFENRHQFFGLASRVMRTILVDHARAKQRAKRSSNGVRVPLDDIVAAYEANQVDVLALDEALSELRERDPRLVELVELRFFGGRSMPESAEILGISLRSVERDWTAARAWLRRKLA